MLSVIFSIVAFIIAILVLVSIHEFGHFWVARRLGVKTLRFSIGFGKALFRWHGRDGTEYVLAMLPLGGYVKLLDEREAPVADIDKPYAFNRQAIWKRFLVIVAGPLTNFLLAFVLFWIVLVVGIQQTKPIIGAVTPDSIAAKAGMQKGEEIVKINQHDVASWQKVLLNLVLHMGEKGTLTFTTKTPTDSTVHAYQLPLQNWRVEGYNPDPIRSLGLQPYRPSVPPVIDRVLPEHVAARAGIQPGDRIIAIDKKPMTDWYQVAEYIQANPNKTVQIEMLRNNRPLTLSLVVGQKRMTNLNKIGFIGAQPAPVAMPTELEYERRYSPLNALYPALDDTLTYSAFNFIVLGKMVLGQISLKGLGGPISIFTSASLAFKQGFVVYLTFLAVLSVMLACINILPIPGLDGGHLLYLGIEAVWRPVSIEAQLIAWRWGLFLLILLMLIATFNDVLRLAMGL